MPTAGAPALDGELDGDTAPGQEIAMVSDASPQPLHGPLGGPQETPSTPLALLLLERLLSGQHPFTGLPFTPFPAPRWLEKPPVLPKLGPVEEARPRETVRALFLSDLHLGARSSQPSSVLRFLKRYAAERIYLVGDIFDLWHGGRLHWSDTHDALLRELVTRAEEGAEVIYLPGNHDAAVRRMDQSRIRHWQVADTAVHECQDGRRLLVLHGDQCDPRLLRWHALTRLGSRVDALARAANDSLRKFRDLSDAQRTMIERSISWVNARLARADRFEANMVALARSKGCDGVICGHSHQPALRDSGGMLFANCGDWIDSRTALLERKCGTMQLVVGSALPGIARIKPLPEGTTWTPTSS